MPSQADVVGRSADLVRAVLDGGPVEEHREAVAALDRDELVEALLAEPARRAFWLNAHNGLVRHRLRTDPDAFDSRRRFFRDTFVTVAGEALSPNDVAHGMLRDSMLSWGFGYLPRLFPGEFERALRVDLDPRIHFALNRGTASCPPIRPYEAATLDDQLDGATAGYLRETVAYDGTDDVATVPRLFSRYRGDFGGKAGVLDFLHRHGAVPPGRNPRLRYADRDPALDLY